MDKKKDENKLVVRDKGGVPINQYGGTIQVLKPPSMIPFSDRYRTKKLEKYQKYVKQGTALIEDMREHRLKQARFEDADTDIEIKRLEDHLNILEVQNRIREETRKNKIADIEDDIGIMGAASRRKKAEEAYKEGMLSEEEKDERNRQRTRRRTEKGLEDERLRWEGMFARRRELISYGAEERKRILSDSNLTDEERELQLNNLEDWIAKELENY